MRAAFDELKDSGSVLPFTALPFTAFLMTEALGQAGQVSEGLAAVNQAIDCSERTEERWRIAELLRVKGELLLLQDPFGAKAKAEDHFQQALDWARGQGALCWELRAATSLARLLCDQGRSADAVKPAASGPSVLPTAPTTRSGCPTSAIGGIGGRPVPQRRR
jgi:predicted ATPase